MSGRDASAELELINGEIRLGGVRGAIRLRTPREAPPSPRGSTSREVPAVEAILADKTSLVDRLAEARVEPESAPPGIGAEAIARLAGTEL